MDASVFISGSFAKGVWEGNDIDLVSLTQNTGYVYSESFVIWGLTYQVLYVPICKLADIISFDLLTLDRIYINILKDCIPIDYDDLKILDEIKGYIGYMETKIKSCTDNDILYHVTHIQDLCSEMSDKRNNAIVLAADLFLMLSRFMTELHRTTSKHLGRAVRQNESAQEMSLKYIEAIRNGDYAGFVETARMVIAPFLVEERRTTTGVSYNVPSDRFCVVYIPGPNSRTDKVREILSDFETCCKDCLSYSFHIGQNQVMGHGTYLFIRFTDLLGGRIVLERLYDVHKKHAETCIAGDFKIIFPYNTAFTSGYCFGGYEIFDSLIPLFCHLDKNIRKGVGEDLLSGIRICNEWLQKMGRSFMTKYLEYLALYAVDPNGIYNARQIRYMKHALNRFYLSRSDNPDVHFDSCDELTSLVDSIVRMKDELEDSEIHFIRTPLSKDKKQMLMLNILDHMLSICMLDAGEKYAVVYQSLKTCL